MTSLSNTSILAIVDVDDDDDDDDVICGISTNGGCFCVTVKSIARCNITNMVDIISGTDKDISIVLDISNDTCFVVGILRTNADISRTGLSFSGDLSLFSPSYFSSSLSIVIF